MTNLNRIVAVLLLGGALLLGVLAWTLARRPPPAPPVQSVERTTFPVVVATTTLSAGKPIPASALRIERLPINPVGAFTDPAVVVGRMPLAEIGAQAPVLDTLLSSGLAERIEPGERAVAVRVDETNAVGNRLRPGNLVDVFFTLKRDGAIGSVTEVERTQARLLLSKVRVLTFGKVDDADAGSDGSATARTAVLAVPLASVGSLTLAEGTGRIVLALRNPRDTDVTDDAALPAIKGVLAISADVTRPDVGSTRAAAGVALDELAGSKGRQPARAASGPSHAIEVIRGGQAGSVAW